MTTALYVLAALLTLLQVWDGYSTYQILKRGGTERNPIVAEIMDMLGVYPGLLVVKCAAAGIAWAIALMDGSVDARAAILVLLTALYVWIAMGNWQAWQEQKGKP